MTTVKSRSLCEGRPPIRPRVWVVASEVNVPMAEGGEQKLIPTACLSQTACSFGLTLTSR